MEKDINTYNDPFKGNSFKKFLALCIVFITILISILILSILKLKENKILCVVLIVLSIVFLVLIILKLIYEIIHFIKISKLQTQFDSEKISMGSEFRDFNYSIETKESNINISKKSRRSRFTNLNNNVFSYKYGIEEGLDQIQQSGNKRYGFNPEKLKIAILIAFGLIAMTIVTLLLYII